MPPSSPALWLLDAARHGRRPALIHAGAVVPYAGLLGETARRAALLEAAGPRAPGPLAVITRRAEHRYWSLLVALFRGLPLLPLPADLPPPSRARLLTACGAALLSGDPALLAGRPVECRGLDDAWLRGDGSAGQPEATPADAAAVQLLIATSGTGGRPRTAMLTGGNLAAATAAAAAVTPLEPGDRWLACLPLDHIGGLSIALRCLAAGAAVSLHEGFDAPRVWAEIQGASVTHLSLVPAMLAALLEQAGGRRPPGALRAVLVGGGPLSPHLARRALEAGWPLRPTYGMSEAASQICTLAALPADWAQGHVGPPLPGMSVSVMDDRGRPGRGPGRIRIAGPMVMAGYACPGLEPGRGLEADGSFVTGDRGTLDDAGHLHVLGRADAALVSGGHTVQPEEVEGLLAPCPGIGEAVVGGTPDPVWGDVVTVWYTGGAAPAAVLAWCREALPAPLRPRRARGLAAIPRLPSGKPDRRRLAGDQKIGTRW